MSIAKRATDMVMGELDVGQFIFRGTGTMLPKKHCGVIDTVIDLHKNHDVIIIDIASGSSRSAVGLLVPTAKLSNWVPDQRYIVQTATSKSSSDECKMEVVSTTEVKETKYELSAKRAHDTEEFPKRHMPRIARLCATHDTYNKVWDTMSLVFIFEKEPSDNLTALMEFIAWTATL